MREKYSEILTYHIDDDNEKKILPYFFSHISRLKGYYNPEKKKYLKHNTSMDYLQEIVTGFRCMKPYKREKLPFSSILNKEKYVKKRVNQDKINNVIRAIRIYCTEVKRVFGSQMDMDIKKALQLNLYDDLACIIQEEQLGYSTMYELLSMVEHEEYGDIKKTLYGILFSLMPDAFYSSIVASLDIVEYIERGDGDIVLYGQPFKKLQKLQDFKPFVQF